MGWKQWTRERLAATDLQALIQDQAVLQFASASARDAAIPTGSRKAGMVAFTADTGSYWGWDPTKSGGAAWSQIGVHDRGAYACTVNGGWTASAGHAPKVRRVGNSRAAFSGWFTNGGAYTGNATQTPLSLPTGFAPKADQVFSIPVGGGSSALVTLLTTGVFRIDTTYGVSIGASTSHFLDAITYELEYTG